MNVSHEQLVELVTEVCGKGEFFTADFTKRSDGTLRTINCRGDVHKFDVTPDGAGLYNPDQHDLLWVWESYGTENTGARAYRSISKEGLKSATIGGVTYKVKP